MKRLITVGALAVGLAVTVVACSNAITTPSEESSLAAWKGRNRVELTQLMGKPKEAVPFPDTGGEMLFYSYEGHHYVFETDALGNITSAVQTR